MNFLKENTEVILYTKNERNFNKFILNNIGYDFGFIQHTMDQNDCGFFEVGDEEDKLLKVLEGANRPLEKSILIDSCVLNSLLYPENYVRIEPYSANDDMEKNDDIFELIQKLINKIKDLEDVRPFLKEYNNIGYLSNEEFRKKIGNN